LAGEIALEIIENLKQARERIKMVVNFGSFAKSQDKEVLLSSFILKIFSYLSI